jgi:hypothetical protein
LALYVIFPNTRSIHRRTAKHSPPCKTGITFEAINVRPMAGFGCLPSMVQSPSKPICSAKVNPPGPLIGGPALRGTRPPMARVHRSGAGLARSGGHRAALVA